jgi:hypothetical protein
MQLHNSYSNYPNDNQKCSCIWDQESTVNTRLETYLGKREVDVAVGMVDSRLLDSLG